MTEPLRGVPPRHPARRVRALRFPGATTWPTRWPPSGSGSIWRFPLPPSSARWPASRGCSAASRFSGAVGRITVVDDYGHHPTEIRATLAAAKAGFDRRVVVVFQPHRYTRTAASAPGFPHRLQPGGRARGDGRLLRGRAGDPRGDRGGSGGGHPGPRPPPGDLRGQRSGSGRSITCARSPGRATSC